MLKKELLKESDGTNINGPSLIKTPDWLPNKLGKYYLYFAHHQGKYIRLAYTDDLKKNWKIFDKGTLQLTDCAVCHGHVASPDVFVDDTNKQIVLYFHSPLVENQQSKGQYSYRAASDDGINFKVDTTALGISYFRVFDWNGTHYAIARTGQLYRSKDGGLTFESGPNPFDKIQRKTNYLRHAAVKVSGDKLFVFYSNIGDKPERILLSTLDLNDDWRTWHPSKPITIVQPEKDYEGVNLPQLPSEIGAKFGEVHQLRDPAFFEEDGKWYLLYSTAGESGIAIGELKTQYQ
ncbi:hypothetical protein H8S90_05100 [Olivibacter sp. SDN3]|nr:hypothetical protein H8S90_05100 [Olivibacter sp. SDN3]